jgi:hypothetical protein
MPVAFRTTNEEIAKALGWHLAAFRRPPRLQHDSLELALFKREEDEDRDRPLLSYYRDGRLDYQHESLRVLLLHVLWDLNRLVPERSRDFLAFHAAAVTGPNGALVLPAPRGTGKSTLTATLLREGFGYLSDELVPLDPITRRVYAYPRPITLDQQAVQAFAGLEDRLDDGGARGGNQYSRFVRPEDLGAAIAGPAPVQALVFIAPRREGRPRLEPIPKAEAVERLAALSMNLYRYAERGIALLSRVSEAGGFLLTGGTASERAALLKEKLS